MTKRAPMGIWGAQRYVFISDYQSYSLYFSVNDYISFIF